MIADHALTLPERQLAAEIAGLLAEGLWRDLGPPDDRCEIYNIGMSNYEAACHALNLVDVYRQGEHYTVHQALVPSEAVRTHVAALDTVSKEDLACMLSAFVANLIGHWGAISGTRETFAAPSGTTKVMKLLAKCDYASQTGDTYQWTDKMSVFMRQWCIWSDADFSLMDAAHARHSAQSNVMAATMPEIVKKSVRAELAAGSVLRAISVIKKHWDGERWLELPNHSQGEGKSPSRLDLRTAKALLQKLER
ncbi:hypothetical protein [uncultured Roseobacter sp.]|uniref:hypothetical protein n=1 Tax=uncultured Roseobacter sp. TaxID=114847 RepID=UPI0026080F96|nr:hypothetical protein [uncultured Roseobacter sp.]